MLSCSSLPLEGGFTYVECLTFLSYMHRNLSYLEYGAGISTLLAASHCGNCVSIEGDARWIARMRNNISANGLDKNVALSIAHIGPTRSLSYPTWKNVTASIYCADTLHADEKFDIVLVDGRFRVACAAHAFKHLRSAESVLLVHDYTTRSWYRQMRRLYTLVATNDTLATFRPKPGVHSSSLEWDARHDASRRVR